MKTTFDPATRAALIARIGNVNEQSTAQWGRMTAFQMLRHCTLWEEWIAGKEQYKQAFIGKIFGKLALKNILRDDKPLGRNTPTFRNFKMKSETGDIEAEKAKWIALLEGHAHFSNPGFVHMFFGRMTEEQVGQMAYKHADHHLRQFGC